MNRFALWLIEYVTPRGPMTGGRDEQMASLQLYPERDRRVRALPIKRLGTVAAVRGLTERSALDDRQYGD